MKHICMYSVVIKWQTFGQLQHEIITERESIMWNRPVESSEAINSS